MELANMIFVSTQAKQSYRGSGADLQGLANYTRARFDPLGRLFDAAKILSRPDITTIDIEQNLPDLHGASDVVGTPATGVDIIDWMLAVNGSSLRATTTVNNFKEKKNSVWAYALAKTALYSREWKDGDVLRNAITLLDKNKFSTSTYDVVLSAKANVVARYPQFWSAQEIEKYRKEIGLRSAENKQPQRSVDARNMLDGYSSLIFLLSDSPEEAGDLAAGVYMNQSLRKPGVVHRVVGSVYLTFMKQMPIFQLEKLYGVAGNVAIKNDIALEIFDRAGIMEDWDTASRYAKQITWADPEGQHLGDSFVASNDPIVRKFLYASLVVLNNDFWACGKGVQDFYDTVGTPIFVTAKDKAVRQKERDAFSEATQTWIGKYLLTVNPASLGTYSSLLSETMADYVNFVTRRSYCGDAQYSKKVFGVLQHDYPDSQGAKRTPYYYNHGDYKFSSEGVEL